MATFQPWSTLRNIPVRSHVLLILAGPSRFLAKRVVRNEVPCTLDKVATLGTLGASVTIDQRFQPNTRFRRLHLRHDDRWSNIADLKLVYETNTASRHRVPCFTESDENAFLSQNHPATRNYSLLVRDALEMKIERPKAMNLECKSVFLVLFSFLLRLKIERAEEIFVSS